MINDTRVDEIYAKCNALTLALSEADNMGPRYYIDKIAVCRNYLNEVSLLVAEVSHARLGTSRALRAEEVQYEMESARLLTVDDAVKRMSNIKDRESMVAHILRDRKNRIEQLKDHMLTIETVSKYVAHRSRELHTTMDAIKNQRRFMHIEVQTGAFYGDERVPSHERSVGMGSGGVSMDLDEKEIRVILDEVSTQDFAAALEGAAEAKTTLQLPPSSVVPQLSAKILEEPKTPVILDDDTALQQFLGDGSALIQFGVQAATVEPSTSAPQTEQEDFSLLLENI